MAAVELRGLGKAFGPIEVLKPIDIAIEHGEFVVLVGPSGCGKSTLLRIIAGLETATRGDLLIHGKRANDIPAQRRNLAMVFQSYALFPHMTARDNIAYGPKLRGETAEATLGLVDRAASMLNLGPYLDRYPRQLSGGQRQRVAMGRAVVRSPDAFLFDEPLSNLDAKLRVQMRTEIKALHKRLGTTVIYVTHDQIEAMTMADRIVVMDHGQVEQIGTPLELYDNPRSVFVAGFLGTPSINFLKAHLSRNSGPRAILTDGREVRLARDVPLADGAPITLAIRPEELEMDEAGLPIEVDLVELTGSETHVVGQIAGNPVIAALRTRVDRNTRRFPVRLPPDKLHLFDGTTGLRL